MIREEAPALLRTLHHLVRLHGDSGCLGDLCGFVHVACIMDSRCQPVEGTVGVQALAILNVGNTELLRVQSAQPTPGTVWSFERVPHHSGERDNRSGLAAESSAAVRDTLPERAAAPTGIGTFLSKLTRVMHLFMKSLLK
jgi:hypothetical protein